MEFITENFPNIPKSVLKHIKIMPESCQNHLQIVPKSSESQKDMQMSFQNNPFIPSNNIHRRKNMPNTSLYTLQILIDTTYRHPTQTPKIYTRHIP